MDNYGRYSAEDPHERTYIQNGILASILLNSGAADFAITGCGTGEGAMLAMNSFPGVICGYVRTPLDAYLFTQVNAGNAVSMPFAMGFGWGAEINLKYVFQSLFEKEPGGGYPVDWAAAEQRNKKVLDGVKAASYRDLLSILSDIDQDLLKGALAEETFPDLFFPNCKDEKIAEFVRNILK